MHVKGSLASAFLHESLVLATRTAGLGFANSCQSSNCALGLRIVDTARSNSLNIAHRETKDLTGSGTIGLA